MSGLIYAVIQVLRIILDLIQVLIFFSVLVSWFSADPSNPLVSTIRSITEPMYRPIRRYITGRFNLGFIDLAPLVLWFIIIFIQKFIEFNGMRYLSAS